MRRAADDDFEIYWYPLAIFSCLATADSQQKELKFLTLCFNSWNFSLVF